MQKKDALNMEKTALYSIIFIKYIFYRVKQRMR